MIPCVKLDGILVHASLKFFVAGLLCSSSLRALQFGFELEHKTMGRKKKKKREDIGKKEDKKNKGERGQRGQREGRARPTRREKNKTYPC